MASSHCPVVVVGLVTKSCPSLCDPVDCSPPGSPVHGYSPGKSAAVGCHFLLQGIFPTLGSNLGLLHCRSILYHLSCQGWLNSVPCQLCAHYTSVSSDLGAVLGTLPTLTVNLPGTIQGLVPTQQMKGRLNNLPRVTQVWPKSVALQTHTFFASCHKKTLWWWRTSKSKFDTLFRKGIRVKCSTYPSHNCVLDLTYSTILSFPLSQGHWSSCRLLAERGRSDSSWGLLWFQSKLPQQVEPCNT